MTTLFDCALGGVTLSSLDKSICVTDVREEAPVYREALTPTWLEGQRLLSRTRESLSVTVRFAIHEDGLKGLLCQDAAFKMEAAFLYDGGIHLLAGGFG